MRETHILHISYISTTLSHAKHQVIDVLLSIFKVDGSSTGRSHALVRTMCITFKTAQPSLVDKQEVRAQIQLHNNGLIAYLPAMASPFSE